MDDPHRISLKSEDLQLRYRNTIIAKVAASLPPWIWKILIFRLAIICTANFIKIRRLVPEIWRKNIFKMGAVRHLESHYTQDCPVYNISI